MLWLEKMDHMTQIMLISGQTLDDDWSQWITWQVTPSLPVAKNRQCCPTDLVLEAMKADLQEYIFEVTKCQFNGLKFLECQNRHTLHNYNTISTCHTNFKWFDALGAEFCLGQIPSVRPPPARPLRPPIRHGHDNTPCSQRLRGKKLMLCYLCPNESPGRDIK